jgi:hypothetical protein
MTPKLVNLLSILFKFNLFLKKLSLFRQSAVIIQFKELKKHNVSNILSINLSNGYKGSIFAGFYHKSQQS